MTTEQIMQDLYDSEINAAVEWFWDGGFDVRLGDHMNGWHKSGCVNSWSEVGLWLMEAAIEKYPNSQFAQKYADAMLAQRETE